MGNRIDRRYGAGRQNKSDKELLPLPPYAVQPGTCTGAKPDGSLVRAIA